MTSIKGLRQRTARRRARGFTLVEMMVSMAAGLLIAAAAFLLARNATTFFQAEANITAAQFSTMVGMTRLQSDLRRAGFLSTPNAAADPKRCGGMGDWPAGLASLAAVNIIEGGSTTAALSQANDLDPDAIVIAGQMNSTEQFTIQAMSTDGAGGWNILIARDGALLRSEASALNAAAAITNVFKVSRFIRVVDKEGREAFGVVSGVNTAGTYPQVSVAPIPVMPVRSTQVTCGCSLPCAGGFVNAIHLVRWDIRVVNPATYPQYAGMFQKGSITDVNTAAKHVGEVEAERTELVRVELDTAGAEDATTLEVVAEYAVDLKFGITVATPAIPIPALSRYPLGDPLVYSTAATPGGGGTPQHIRAVQVRLSTRASRRDRDEDILPVSSKGGIYRFSLGANGGYARARTLITDVRLPNLANVPW